ncbi:MAG: glutathione peroxidase [Synechococcus sp. TMED19]|nr:MAG: glutathione peroxidase [Synechococcus sp. TMED19]
MAPSVNGVTVTSADGTNRDLASDNGHVLLIVNVASRCGFTRQYAGLQQLQERYSSQGLKVIGFPCNDFGGQEPGTLEEIQAFCSTTYGVSFELMNKVGANSAPFDTLTQAEPAGAIAWNFEKFLVGKDGTVLSRFKSGVEPDSSELMSAIEAALAA